MIFKFIQLCIIGLTVSCICVYQLSATELNEDENLLTAKTEYFLKEIPFDYNRVLKRTKRITDFDTQLNSGDIRQSSNRAKTFFPVWDDANGEYNPGTTTAANNK
uniref:Uncharacterized protein n=1 Tax=Glossina brevipalpis TaxID=37001 RepID=A0A1A9WPA9_9MUSC